MGCSTTSSTQAFGRPRRQAQTATAREGHRDGPRRRWPGLGAGRAQRGAVRGRGPWGGCTSTSPAWTEALPSSPVTARRPRATRPPPAAIAGTVKGRDPSPPRRRCQSATWRGATPEKGARPEVDVDGERRI